MGKDKVSMLDLFLAILNFLNLKEARANKLSLTNLMVFVCIVKVALAPQASVMDLGMLMLSVLNYMHKRNETNKSVKAEADKAVVEATQASVGQFTELKEAMEKVVGVQNKITADVANFKQTFDIVAKQAEDTKKLISQSNLAAAFQPRK